jgi:hypothetical protein
LTFYPPSKKWVKSSDCVWEAKRGLATRYILAEHYPDQKHLFQECLGIQDATVDMVLEHIMALDRHLTPDEPTVLMLQQLLLALSQYLGELSAYQQKVKIGTMLKRQRIIPVYKMENGRKIRDLMQLDWGIWFYADQKRYFDAFDGEVWLAEFPVSEWSDLKHLHTVGSYVFTRRERRLSRAAKEEKASAQEFQPSEYGTRLYGWKGKYLRR